MENTSENKSAKHVSIALLAHVDAGKTTLSEAMLYLSGAIRKAGRVDNGDAFLDTDALERSRGITIFSKQAEFHYGETAFTLLDTPGHVDFSAEMERTLQVLDYAVLLISGADGVQGHTKTLWRLLRRYGIPTFLFVNKMDQSGTDRERLHSELKEVLSDCCVDFSKNGDGTYCDADFFENAAVCDEDDDYQPDDALRHIAAGHPRFRRHPALCHQSHMGHRGRYVFIDVPGPGLPPLRQQAHAHQRGEGEEGRGVFPCLRWSWLPSMASAAGCGLPSARLRPLPSQPVMRESPAIFMGISSTALP